MPPRNANGARTLRIAALAVTLLANASALPAVPLSSIEVTGNKRVSSEAIIGKLGIRPGDDIDAAAESRALKALFAMGQFADVRLRRDAGRLIVEVIEHPVIRAVRFEGNVALDKDALGKAAGLKPGQVASRGVIEHVRAAIISAYAQKGIVATTSHAIEPLPGGRADVVVSIVEEKAGRIAAVAFIGNASIDAAELRDVATTRAAGWLDLLGPQRPPDQGRLHYDREQIARYYRTKGFADVEVSAPLVERDRDSGDWIITFSVTEGTRYRLGTVNSAAGFAAADTDLIARHSRMKSGDIWDHGALDALLERMTLDLLAAGRDTLEPRASLKRDQASARIDVEIDLVTVAARRIERIEISGNVRTRDEVIRRELFLAEGSAFHPLLADRSRRRLIALGLFKSVEIEPAPSRDKRSIVVSIKVEEQDSRKLEWGGGYSSTEGVTGDITFTERNLMGRGQTLRLSLAASEKRIEGNIGLTEPRLLGYRLAGSLDLFYRVTDSGAIASHHSTKAGARTGLGFEVAENVTAGLTYSLSRTTLSDVTSGASAAVRQAAGFPGATQAAYLTSAVGTSLTYDTRNRATLPMSGVYMTASQELAGLGGDVRHLKTTTEFRGYAPVTGNTVLATRASAGTISGWGGSEVRLLEMFYKGGETIRGFAAGGIGPRDSLGTNKDALGGTNFIATTAELRSPLPLTPSDFGLRVAVFADAGSLWGTSKSVRSASGVVGTSATLRASVGVGMIWDSPIGPLRVDYARPLAKQAFDKTQNWSFGLAPF